MGDRFVRWLDEVGLDDVALVGGKNASLGELHRALCDVVSVPEGFVITADAYRAIFAQPAVCGRVRPLLRDTDWSDDDAARRASADIRAIIARARFPAGLRSQIVDAYRRLEQGHGRRVAVAVRSSATAEDLPDASFAGQHESFLNVSGVEALLQAVRRCLASLFTQRAILYRIHKGFAHEEVALSVGVQRMVRAGDASSGVMFTLDTESGFRDVVLVNAVWGLGEAIVQGIADPDEYLVYKPALRDGHRYVLRHTIRTKTAKLVFDRQRATTRWRRVAQRSRNAPCLEDDAILDLATQARRIEEHYSRRSGRPVPMDIEWAKDGPDGDLYIIQARPETVHARAGAQVERYRLRGDGPSLVTGQAVGERIAAGPVRRVASAADLHRVQAGDVLVAPTTSPDWEPVMKRAAAIVTEHGGRTCHAAIIARELGIPAIVGAAQARERLADGAPVTVTCAEGLVGRVLAGRVPYDVETTSLAPVAIERPRLLVNLGNPDLAFRTASLPVDGVGLARMEFIITNSVQAHPQALLELDRAERRPRRGPLARLTRGYPSGADYFVTRLAEGIAVMAAAFAPRPVIVRTSDFKTNEYAELLGGAAFEQPEANPMIGLRGAARYLHDSYRPAFALECRALARVRAEMKLANLVVMIPFCRTLAEARGVLELMAANGLVRGRDGLQVFMMAEVPSNALLMRDFAELFDGFSIGSNDLTQLVLGVDRDAEILHATFDEEDPAVLRAIELVIDGAHALRRSCGICGQGPSDSASFFDWLVAHGIDSISLNPDSVPAMLQRLSRLAAPGAVAAA